MTETPFALDQRNFRNCQSCFRGNQNHLERDDAREVSLQ
jgi:hypothetical protein